MALENKSGIADSTELARAEEKLSDREVYMRGIDAGYHYEGCNVFKTGEIFSPLFPHLCLDASIAGRYNITTLPKHSERRKSNALHLQSVRLGL